MKQGDVISCFKMVYDIIKINDRLILSDLHQFVDQQILNNSKFVKHLLKFLNIGLFLTKLTNLTVSMTRNLESISLR